MITKVLLKNIKHDKKPLERAHETDACYDIRANASGIVPPGKTHLVKTGIYMSIPQGYWLAILPRSGNAIKSSIIVPNSPGCVDSGFLNEIGVVIHNLGDKDFSYVEGDRIAQATFVKIPEMNLEYISEDEFSKIETERGTNGFGSTGVK